MDRVSLWFVFLGFCAGSLLISLGLYDWLSGEKIGETESILNIYLFDIILIIIGLGIAVKSIVSCFDYSKLYFDAKTITSVSANGWHNKQTFKEKINNYTAVRFRIEFFAFGFLNRNRYVIELYHKNPSKIVPLYISTSDKNIRNIWKEYAKKFNLPALIETDKGPVVKQIEDFGKSVKEMAQTQKISTTHSDNIPSSLIVKNKDRKTIIKIRNRLWDAYTIMALIFTAIPTTFCAIAFVLAPNWEIAIIGIFLLVIIFFILMSREKLVLKKYKIVNVHKFMGLSRKKSEIEKNNIEDIDVTLNPASGRHYITIISNNKTIIFGKKLPLDDLHWLKNYLLFDLCK